jgi:hypothetical protein
MEVAVSVWPLAASLKVIVAPGTTAPLGSLMIPRSDVVAFCANPVAVQRQNKNTRANTPMRLIKSFLQGDNSLTRPIVARIKICIFGLIAKGWNGKTGLKLCGCLLYYRKIIEIAIL